MDSVYGLLPLVVVEKMETAHLHQVRFPEGATTNPQDLSLWNLREEEGAPALLLLIFKRDPYFFTM